MLAKYGHDPDCAFKNKKQSNVNSKQRFRDLSQMKEGQVLWQKYFP